MSKCIYTVETGGYDRLRVHKKVRGYDLVLLTDNTTNKRPYQLNQFDRIKKIDSLVSPQFTQRRAKVLSHQYLPEYEETIYIDANLQNWKINNWTPSCDFGVMGHPTRESVSSEIMACLELKKCTPGSLGTFTRWTQNIGFDDIQGLYGTGVLVRRNTAKVRRLMETWWSLMEPRSLRDQLTLPIALWYLGGATPELCDISDFYQTLKKWAHIKDEEKLRQNKRKKLGGFNIMKKKATEWKRK